MQYYLKKITEVEAEVDNALGKSDFNKLAYLSAKLDALVRGLAKNTASMNQNEKDLLKELLIKIQSYEDQTSARFKVYASKVSQQTKMHQAYKPYRD